jgi:hypothetical protein
MRFLSTLMCHNINGLWHQCNSNITLSSYSNLNNSRWILSRNIDRNQVTLVSSPILMKKNRSQSLIKLNKFSKWGINNLNTWISLRCNSNYCNNNNNNRSRPNRCSKCSKCKCINNNSSLFSNSSNSNRSSSINEFFMILIKFVIF